MIMKKGLYILITVIAVLILIRILGNDSTGPEPAADEHVSLDLVEDCVHADFLADTPDFLFGTEQGKARYREADFRYHSGMTGWYSFRDESRDQDLAILLGGAGEFSMTLFDRSRGFLVMEGCAVEGDGTATMRVFVNGKRIGEAALERGLEPVTVRFPFEESDLKQENVFRVEVDGGVESDLPGLPFSVTLSAFFLSARLDGDFEGPDPSEPLTSPPVLIQPSGTVLLYYHMPESSDRFKASVSVKGTPLKVEVAVGDEPVFSRILSNKEGKIDIDVDLTAFAGNPVGIRLASGVPGVEKAGAYTRWEAPRITGEAGRKSDSKKTKGDQPNIVVILLDAASPYFFNCISGTRVAAPAAEALAQDSAVFLHAVTPAPYTLPSVGSIMTGLLPDRHGVVFNANREGINLRLSKETPTLASALKTAGYTTLAVVTNPNAAGIFGYDKGFDRYDELFKDPVLWNEGVAPGAAVERAKRLMEEAKGPRFLYLHIFQPHAPYTPPEAYTRRFVEPYTGVVDGTRAAIDGFKDLGVPDLGEKDFEHLRHLYEANLAHADEAVDGLLKWMKEKNLYDDTLIVLCSDHGEAFGEHRSIEHGHHLYDEALRVPLLFKYPGNRFKGERIDDVVSLTDLAPTLAAAGGADAGTLSRDGVDLTRRLEGKIEISDRAHAARSDLFKPSFSLRWRGYHFIHDTLNRREELYFMPDDPRQENNVVHEKPLITGYLRARLGRLLIEMAREGGGERIELDSDFIHSVEELGYSSGTGDPKGSTDFHVIKGKR